MGRLSVIVKKCRVRATETSPLSQLSPHRRLRSAQGHAFERGKCPPQGHRFGNWYAVLLDPGVGFESRRPPPHANSDDRAPCTVGGQELAEGGRANQTRRITREPAEYAINGRAPALTSPPFDLRERGRRVRGRRERGRRMRPGRRRLCGQPSSLDQRPNRTSSDGPARPQHGQRGTTSVKRGTRLSRRPERHPSVVTVSTTRPSTERSASSSRT